MVADREQSQGLSAVFGSQRIEAGRFHFDGHDAVLGQFIIVDFVIVEAVDRDDVADPRRDALFDRLFVGLAQEREISQWRVVDGAAEAQKGAAAPPLPLTAAETGLLLLCCALPEAEDRPLTMAQFQELAKRARALGPGGENPLRELTARDLERLGYSQEQCGRIVRLLSRETQLERYLRAAERNGIVPITRLSPRYPARLRQTLGQRCPAVLFAKGDETPLASRCISVVGSRELTEGGRAFAEAAGRLIARSGYALCSGGAMGADRAAQEACLTAGGSAVVFPAGRLLDCPAQAHVLYLAEQGYDLPFSAQRALSRNHFIHAMGEKTLVAQCRAGAGGTWDGTTENLRRGWSPVFVSDDGSEGAQALIARGAVPVRTLSGLDDLQPAQLQF